MKKIYSLLMMALLPMLASAGTNVVKFQDIKANAGDEVTLGIELDNEDDIYGVGFTLNLPDGVSLAGEPELGDRLYKTHELSYSEKTLRFAVYTLNKKVISGYSGIIVDIPLKIDENVTDGIYDISLKDIYDVQSGQDLFNNKEYTGKLIVGNPATSSITATDITARAGKTFTLPLNLENTDEITEAEFKLVLPEGVTLESAKVTSRGNGHEVDYKLRAGKYNFEVFSEKGNAFSGTEGAFVELTLKADAGIAAGDYDIQVSDISLITADDKEVAVADFSVKLTIEEPTATITASSLAAKAGKSIVLPINLENDNEITEIDFKLTLPAEVTLDSAMVTDRGADQEVSYKLRSGGYKFEVTSPAGLPFSGTEGAALNITLKTDKTTAAGDYDIQVSEILLITKEGKEISVKDFTVTLTLAEFKEITIGDITALIDEYLEQ